MPDDPDSFSIFSGNTLGMRFKLYFSGLAFLALMACGEMPEQKESEEESVPVAETEERPEDRLAEMGLILPSVSTPVANYVNAVRTGNLVFLAGKGPRKADGTYITGKLGADLSVEEGYEAARICALNQLAVLKAELGELSKIKRVVKVLGMVNAVPEFTQQPEVINGFSDLLVEVLGERGKHARAAVGMGSLPRGIAVEIELVVEVEE
jgi:enamine deaminase RidA (YjgF/YER057c/UK114 family)